VTTTPAVPTGTDDDPAGVSWAAGADPAGVPWRAVGVDPAWSRIADVTDPSGRTHRWHLLDRPADGDQPALTVLCVHGNPTWSYLWRGLIAQAPPDVRVLAVDQLGMGLSERTRSPRRLGQRIDDLLSLTDALDLAGPVIVVAHDWGGPVALGWVAQVRTYRPEIELAGICLLATAVHQPDHLGAPPLIRLARLPAVRPLLTTTPLFLTATLRVGAPELTAEEVAGYRLPYRRAAHRRAIGDFVADIPLNRRHASAAALAAVAASLTSLGELPVLLLWGGRDPVFGDAHLRDLCDRIPHADVHRYADGHHLLPEDPRVPGDIWRWVAWVRDGGAGAAAAGAPDDAADSAAAGAPDDLPPLWAALLVRAGMSPGPRDNPVPAAAGADPDVAELTQPLPIIGRSPEARIGTGTAAPSAPRTPAGSDDPADVELTQPLPMLGDSADVELTQPLPMLGDKAQPARRAWPVTPTAPALTVMRAGRRGGRAVEVTWRDLALLMGEVRAGLIALGVQPGQRIALLVPPGAELVATLYACWSVGAVAVLTDAGSGVPVLRANLAAAGVHHAVAVRRAHPLLRMLRLPGHITTVAGLRRAAARAARTARAAGPDRPPAQPPALPPPQPGDLAVVVFTSGSTGPAKGVRYTHAQVAATCAVLQRHYRIDDEDVLIAAFAPWALLGPALGVASVIPAMDLTRPATLTARGLAQAVAATRGTLLWASPAAIRTILATVEPLLADHARATRRAIRRGRPVPADPFGSVRLVLIAGAPVALSLLERAGALAPAAQVRTPYGMTEALPLTEADLRDVRTAEGDGVLVGAPLPGVTVAVAPLDFDGVPSLTPATAPGVSGEILVRAPHMRAGYDRLWSVHNRASTPAGWHRTGDVGHLDEQGRLWIEGRLGDVIRTAAGPVTPVGIEQAALRASDLADVACVGVGPAGTQQVVLVTGGGPGTGLGRHPESVSPEVLDAIRAAAADVVPGAPGVVALLRTGALPVDTRHGAKIDRPAVAVWAAGVLSGRGG